MELKGKKVLLTGGSGLVGAAIAREFGDAGCRVLAPSHGAFDLLKTETIVSRVLEFNPKLIINCAALTGHENCERQPELALRLNALAPLELAIAAEKLSVPMVQISTSAVFDGKKETPYVESDQPAPVNLYGGSKYLGETLVAAHCTNAYIVRLPMVFGPGGQQSSFIDRMAGKLLAGEELFASMDEVNTPLFSLDLAKAIHELCASLPCGTYHLAGGEVVSLYALLCRMAELLPGAKQVQPVDACYFQRSCSVPKNGGLCSESRLKVRRRWKESLPMWLMELTA